MNDATDHSDEPGWASTYQVISRLNPSAAQYGGRMRQARRCANVAADGNRHPERAGPRPSEKPDRTMNIATPPRPWLSKAAQNGTDAAGAATARGAASLTRRARMA